MPKNRTLHTVPLSRRQPFGFDQEQRLSLLLYHPDGVEVVPLIGDRSVTVGRGPDADVVIEHRSLSWEHARFERRGDGVWVEDLGSTNGTLVNGQKIERQEITPADQVNLGSLLATLHRLGIRDPQLGAVVGHEQFVERLEQEVLRHRTFRHTLGLVMVRAADERHLSCWWPRVSGLLGPVHEMAVYAPAIAEILVFETSEEALRELTAKIVATDAGPPPLLCGAGLFPATATSAAELLEAARTAVYAATTTEPAVVTANNLAAVDNAGGLVVASEPMQRVFKSVDRLASAIIPVLISGETGSGKELVARALHERGDRRTKPMRTVNCGAIPEQLIESTLFGHERGAFTGADRCVRGVFEEANGGTVFLDEIAELSAPAQAALLRVLESGRIVRVGSSAEIDVDVRVIAATHRNLEAMCEEGTFRWDLLYRLNAMMLKIPPLRERPADIEPLARHFINEANQANGRQVQGLTAEALRLLGSYPWHGNVRELRNVVHRAVVMCPGQRIDIDDFPERLLDGASASPSCTGAATELADESAPAPISLDGDIAFKTRVLQYESRLIREALSQTGWVQTEAARLLKIPVRTLSHKIKVLEIRRVHRDE